MKTLFVILIGILSLSFTHPFAQEGSVDTDRGLLERRAQKARENRREAMRAEEAVKQKQEENREIDRNLQPEILLQDNDMKEGSIE